MNTERAVRDEVLTVRDAVVDLLTRNNYVVQQNVEGVTHEKALELIGPGGSNLNWLLGHMTASRDVCTRLLEAEPAWDKDRGRLYGRGTASIKPENATRLEELISAHAEAGKRLSEALMAAGTESLTRPNPRNAGESVMDAIWFLVWHDTYHTGQTALYRRLAGLDGVF